MPRMSSTLPLVTQTLGQWLAEVQVAPAVSQRWPVAPPLLQMYRRSPPQRPPGCVVALRASACATGLAATRACADDLLNDQAFLAPNSLRIRYNPRAAVASIATQHGRYSRAGVCART